MGNKRSRRMLQRELVISTSTSLLANIYNTQSSRDSPKNPLPTPDVVENAFATYGDCVGGLCNEAEELSYDDLKEGLEGIRDYAHGVRKEDVRNKQGSTDRRKVNEYVGTVLDRVYEISDETDSLRARAEKLGIQ